MTSYLTGTLIFKTLSPQSQAGALVSIKIYVSH